MIPGRILYQVCNNKITVAACQFVIVVAGVVAVSLVTMLLSRVSKIIRKSTRTAVMLMGS